MFFPLAMSLVSMFSVPNDQPEHKILEVWTEAMTNPSLAIDYPGRFFLGGATLSDDSFIVADSERRISKRSISTGESLWTKTLDGETQARWTVDKDGVYGGDSEGNIYKLSLETGEELWKSNTKGVYFSAPLVEEGFVYLMNSYGKLQAYETDYGAWQWQQEDPELATFNLWSPQGPVLFSGRIVSGFPSGNLGAYEPSTGSRVWSEEFGPSISDGLGLNDLGSLASKAGYLVASSFSGDVKAYRESSGSKKLLWQKRHSLHAPVEIDPESKTVYAVDRQGNLFAWNLEDGYLKWKAELGALGSKPNYLGDWLWVGDSSGRVHIFNRNTGDPIARSKSYGSPIYNEVIPVDDREAIILSSTGILRRLKLYKTN